jgi:hypothetical protein
MIFQASEQFERLQAVDAELLVKIVCRREVIAWVFKMGRRKIQDFVGGLLNSSHDRPYFTGSIARWLFFGNFAG